MSMEKRKKDALWLREKLSKGEHLIGSHIFAGSPMLTELMASMEFDVMWVDMEHAPMDKKDILNNIIAVRAGGACSMVRVAWNDPILAKPILDMGPDVLLFPNIRNLEEAKQAIAACKYPPEGIRGYGPQRAIMFGECSMEEYVSKRAGEMLCAIQIEHIDGVENLEEIAQLEGIDLFIVGPGDLSASVGLIGQMEHPKLLDLYDRIGEVLTKAGKVFGVSCSSNPVTINQWINRGAQLIFCGFDTCFVRDGARKLCDDMRKLTED